MDAPKCKMCGRKHWGLCDELATNSEDTATNEEKVATNIKVSDRTLNRRDRIAYNEYQREYMRRRRGGV